MTAATVAAPPITPAITLPITGNAPPIATDWAPANKLPATTFPMEACVAAANVPKYPELKR